MKFERQPLISVLTPVYNGERYLSECIQSVFGQTYQNWEYIIVNNCSDDRSLDIAQSYAKRDRRVRVISNDSFLPVMRNWNHGIRQISPYSKYFKMVHADDLLMPRCLEQMALLAEQNPNVGAVGAYWFVRDRVEPRGMAYPTSVLSGRSACRIYLLEGLRIFGTPSSILIRADLLRGRESVYNEHSTQYADTELMFDILQTSDFGFVQQILTFTRLHDSSITRTSRRFMPAQLGKLHLLKLYGDACLSKDELRHAVNRSIFIQHYVLCRGLFRSERKEIWDYHRNVLAKIDFRIRWTTLIRAFLSLMSTPVIHPLKSYESAMRKVRGRRHRGTSSLSTVRKHIDA